MENVTLEELQKQIAALQDKLDRVDDYRKIMNVYSKFWHYYEMGKYEERFDLIAHHTPGVTVEIGARGVFEGRESAHRSLVDTELGFEHSHAVGMKRLFPDVDFPSEHAGMLESTLIGSPIIEIAEDRKTAHGVFIALQSVAKTHDNDPKPRSMWIWWKTAIDFVNEDGIWRIWHFNNNPYYATGSTEDWVTNAVHMAGLRMPDDPEGYVLAVLVALLRRRMQKRAIRPAATVTTPLRIVPQRASIAPIGLPHCRWKSRCPNRIRPSMKASAMSLKSPEQEISGAP